MRQNPVQPGSPGSGQVNAAPAGIWGAPQPSSPNNGSQSANAAPSGNKMTALGVKPLGKPLSFGKLTPLSTTPAPIITTPPATPSPADQPAQAATVHFSNGLLTVHAVNSSLAQILQDASTQTGMTLEGAPEDDRVFGDFGPAPVSKVVAQLLDGGTSNYLLFGQLANLAPRSLVLSPKTSLAPGEAAAAPAQAAVAQSDDDDDDDAPAVQAPIRPLIPNPPQQQIQPPQGQPNNGVRTPQQILEEMQRRRDQQNPPE